MCLFVWNRISCVCMHAKLKIVVWPWSLDRLLPWLQAGFTPSHSRTWGLWEDWGGEALHYLVLQSSSSSCEPLPFSICNMIVVVQTHLHCTANLGFSRCFESLRSSSVYQPWPWVVVCGLWWYRVVFTILRGPTIWVATSSLIHIWMHIVVVNSPSLSTLKVDRFCIGKLN